MRRAVFVFLLLAALAAPAAARADDGQVERARTEVVRARELVDQSLAAAQAGDRERAYDLAREAYLDHFEYAEIPLRLRDPNLVLDLEFSFAKLRNGIRDGAPLSELNSTAQETRVGLRKVDLTLADPGLAAPILAFFFSFTILFREGLEAVLLLAILLGSLEAGRARNFRRPLGLGVLGAVVAVAVLFAVTFWLVARLEQRRRMEFMRARTAGAIAAGSALAFAGLGFTAVFREGFETVLFYQALILFAQGLLEWVALGAAAAAAALGVVGWAVLKLGKRLPVKQLLLAGASTLLLLSVAFAGNAVRSLQEGDWISVTPIDGGWARLPVYLAELTGIHPTREGIFVQLVLLGIYAVGAAYMFAWLPLRRRALEAARA